MHPEVKSYEVERAIQAGIHIPPWKYGVKHILVDAFQCCGSTWLLACSELLFLVAVLDCCWLDREGVTFTS